MALSLQDYLAQAGWNSGQVNPQTANMQTGGTLPPVAMPGAAGNNMNYSPTPNPINMQFGQTGYNFSNLPSGSDMVQGNLEAMLSPNSDYIRNARQRGIEYAGSRGGLNSTIAAGASERAAIEAAAPLASEATQIDVQRQQLEQRNWLEGQAFNREFMGNLAMMPVTNSMNMMSMVQQAALQDPALFTPEVISGYTNFFDSSMNNLLKNYFGGTGSTV